MPCDILLGNTPGAMAFTVMPYCAHSAARERVKFTHAGLAGVVGDAWRMKRGICSLQSRDGREVFTMRPYRAGIIA